MEFKEGQILNCKGWGIFGFLVRLRNKFVWGETGWAHSAIITEVGEDYIFIAEALNKGFVITAYDKWWLENKLEEGFFVLGEVKKDINNIKENAKKYVGIPYGWLDIFTILFSGFSKYNNSGAKNLICSEAVCRILYDSSNKKINFEEEFGVRYDLIEPMHLWKSNQIEWKNN